MTPEEDDKIIAEKVMGWKLDETGQGWLQWNGEGTGWQWTGYLAVEPQIVPDEEGGYGTHQEPWDIMGTEMWKPSQDRNHLAMAEMKLAEADLFARQYAARLYHKLQVPVSNDLLLAIRTVSPRICVQAMAEVVSG